MSIKRVVVALAVMLAVAGLVVGVMTGGFATLYAAGRSVLVGSPTAAGSLPSGTGAPQSATSSASGSASPSPSAGPSTGGTVQLPPGVLAAAQPGSPPDPTKLAARIAAVKVKNAKGSYSGAVADVGTGKLLFSHNAAKGYIPASTMKLLTSTAALSILGPEHTFTTSVVSAQRGRIVLVGGGDPYLVGKASATTAYPGRASIGDLAAATATALKAQGVRAVSLGYDASLFTGPAWNSHWPTGGTADYRDQVSRTSALWVNEEHVAGSPGPRYSDPARNAADAFAAALKKRGIKVRAVAAAKAPASATPVAAVSSMPLELIVQHLLMVSDNDAAEVLLRQAAIGVGKPGSTAAGVAAVRARLVQLGVWQPGTAISDGSGLSRQTKVPAAVFVRLLRLAAEEQHPELRGVITGLPVAGVEGSLRVRFFDDESLAGRGVVRAKTGTLRKVHSLAGFARDRDGSLLVFAFLVNNPKNDYAATVWLDRVTTTIATCGCAR